jgi:serine/threonine protein kinase
MSANPKYILTERVAQGGMAEIHLGKIVGSDGFSRVCAFKRILPHFARDKEFIQMFRQEAMVAKQLQNKNIVQVFDFVADEQSFMLVMEYVDGQDLRSVLAGAEEVKRRIPTEVCCYIMIEILSGLSFAHSALDVSGASMNIIHRDVSPQNVLLSYEGDVKITDFGIAKVQNSGGNTQVGVLKGKFRYMSPEQAMGKEIDARTDVFAAGVILYEMITMTRLFKGDDMVVLEQVRKCNIVPPSSVRNTRVPPELEAIMMKMLARDPVQRYQTAKAALRDLSRFLYGFRPDFFSGEVAEFMQLIFRDKITSSRERLRSTLALPVDAIGRATRGMDVVAPESAMSMVLDVSDHSQVGRAAGQNEAQANRPAPVQLHGQQSPATVRSPQRGVQQAASGDGMAQKAGVFPLNSAAAMRDNQGRQGGGAQAGRSYPPGSSGPGPKDQHGHALSLSPRQVAKASSELQAQQIERSRVVATPAASVQLYGQTGQIPLGGRTVSRRVSVRARSKGSPLLIVLVGIIIIAGVLVVALRRNDIPYTVDLEISTLPKVPFRFDVTGSNFSDTQMATSPVRFTLKGGDYEVKISRPGFQPQTFSVSTALFMRLIRKTIVMENEGPLGQLRLTTQPPGAKITSPDGYYSEVSPALLSFLPLGKPLVFEVRHPKCQPAVYRETLPRSAEQSVLVRSLTLKGCE